VDAAALREEIERLGPWHHAVEVAAGVTTGTVGRSKGSGDRQMPAVYLPERMIHLLVDNLYGEAGFAGRSFLDCACNAGGHVFAATKFGAGRGFGFDARQHWIDQALFLKRHLPGDTAFDRFDLDALPAKGLGQFDVTLFSGIFYHLPDPISGLKIAADQTRELLIVNTSVLPRAEKGLALSQESASHLLSGIAGLAWLPSGPDVVQDILAWCGFPHSRVDMDWRPPGQSRWRRIQVLGARDPALFEHYDRRRPDASARRAPAPWRRALRRLLNRLDV
jgi:SAM-dependent methyltransferase